MIGLTIALIYYLIVRPYEFAVNFKTNTLPGDIIQTVRIWNRSLDKAQIVAVDSFETLSQELTWNNKKYFLKWSFSNNIDTITSVNIRISEPNRKILNKILIPFTDQQIERDADEMGQAIYDILQWHLEITKVRISGEAKTKPLLCVCQSLVTSQVDKANGMMRSYPLFISFINKTELAVDGPPMIAVNKWKHSEGILEYDFCFPIKNKSELNLGEPFFYREFGIRKVLQAVYYGNYITSDRAWYALIQYARSKNYQIDSMPVELFYDNPTLGINERSWKAVISVPIQD